MKIIRSIFAVCILGIIFFAWIGSHKNLAPTSSGPQSTTPDSTAKTADTSHKETADHKDTANPWWQTPDVETPSENSASENVYSIAIVTASALPLGKKLVAQGRVERYDYADGMRSRPFNIIEDDQRPDQKMLCAIRTDVGRDVAPLFRAGEIVRVSGEYMGTFSLAGNPPMPIFADCKVAK